MMLWIASIPSIGFQRVVKKKKNEFLQKNPILLHIILRYKKIKKNIFLQKKKKSYASYEAYNPYKKSKKPI